MVALPAPISLRIAAFGQCLRAGGTLAAGFIFQEREEVAGEVHHAIVFVHHDHAAGTHHGPHFDQLIVVDGQIEMLSAEYPAGGPAGLDTFEFLTVL